MNKKALLLMLLSANALNARQYNYRDVPVGQRSVGMGTTSVALPDDLGSVIYNPAMLALQKESQISAALTSYTKVDVRNGNHVGLFESAKSNVSETSFRAMPSMVGGTLNTYGYTWGGGIFMPRFFQISGNLDDSDSRAASFSAQDEAVWISMFVSNKIRNYSWGLSLSYVSQTTIEKFTYISNSSGIDFQLIDRSLESNAITAVLGGTYEASKKLRFGLSFRTPFLSIGGKGSILEATSSDPIQDKQSSDVKHYSQPMRLSFGSSYNPSKRWLLAADLHLYPGQSLNLTNSSQDAFNLDAKAIINAAIGAEYQTWKYLSVRAGLYTNLSSSKGTPTHTTAINDKVNLYGTTGSLVITRATGEVSLGGYLMGGQGQVSDVLNNSPAAIPRSLYFYGFTIASTFKF